MHIDGPYARYQDPKYSADNKDIILTIRSNTLVNTLGKVNDKQVAVPSTVINEYKTFQSCINLDNIIGKLHFLKELYSKIILN